MFDFLGTDPGTPSPRNIRNEGAQSLASQAQLAPAIFGLEAKYQPMYQNLGLLGLEAALTGRTIDPIGTEYVDPVYAWRKGRQTKQVLVPGFDRPVYGQARSILDIFSEAQPKIQDITTQSRIGEISDVATLGGYATQAFRNADPNNAALINMLNQQAQQELAAGTALDPAMRRTVQQSTRAAQAARGMGYGLPDSFEEATNTGSLAEQVRRNRQDFAFKTIGMNQATTVDPFMAVLGRPASAMMFGPGLAAQSQGMGRGPSMFDPFSGYASDVFNTNYNAKAAANIAAANNNAAIVGSMMSL